MRGIGSLSPHASLFKFFIFFSKKTANSTELSLKCLLEIHWKSYLLICQTPCVIYNRCKIYRPNDQPLAYWVYTSCFENAYTCPRCKTTSLCVQRLRFVPTWLTYGYTDTQTTFDQLILVAQQAELKCDTKNSQQIGIGYGFTQLIVATTVD